MKKKILVVLSLVGILATSIPAPDVQAAWKVTDQGRQYTTNSTLGYATGFKKIKGNWYYFDKQGIMKTGWVYTDRQWYYLRANGKMAKNTWIGNFYVTADGSMARNTRVNGVEFDAYGNKVLSSSGDSGTSSYSKKKKNGWYQSKSEKTWYYYNDQGVKAKGWLTLPNGKYYLDPDTGAMETGFTKIGRSSYYFNKSTGKMQTGWYKVGRKRYYSSKSGIVKKNRWLSKKTMYAGKKGAMVTGWATIKGERYYFSPSTAKKVTGWQKLDDKWYCFDKNGIMAKNKWMTYGPTRKKCYLQSDGSMASSQWVGKYHVSASGYRDGQTRTKGLFYENGKTYYNDKKYNKVTGWVTVDSKRYYFGSDFAAVKGWQTIDNKRFYFDLNGVMQTGLLDIGTHTYYFNTDGSMVASATIMVNGVAYTFDADGAYIDPDIPADATKGEQIAAYAKKFRGNPYVWGGTSLTNGADCSGFTMSVMKHFGISIPRVAEDQANGYSPWGGIYNKGKSVIPDERHLLPGDLVFYYSPVGHVGIYIGNGQIIHASNATTGIIISDFDYTTPVSAMRYWA